MPRSIDPLSFITTDDPPIRRTTKQNVTKFKAKSHSGKSPNSKLVCLVIFLIFLFLFTVATFTIAIIAYEKDHNDDPSTVVASMVSSSFVKSPLEGENYTIVIPSYATKLTQNLYYLGQGTANKRQLMNGYLYVHRVPNEFQSLRARMDEGLDYDTNSSLSTNQCFGTYAKGAKWKHPANFVIDTTNRLGLSDDFIISNLLEAMRGWNEAAETVRIFGDRIEKSSVHTNGADLSRPDGYSEIRFGNIGEPGVVALTAVWGYFDGRESDREILEADQIYNQKDYSWGDAHTNPRVMHFRGIAMHELGHWLGLTDQYDEYCSEVTMYGYSRSGETKKETLAAPDKVGLCYLYQSCRNYRR